MIKAEAPTVLAAVSMAAKTVEPKHYAPILTCVRIEAADGLLRVQGSNLDQWIEASVAVEGALSPTCVDAQRLLAALKSVGAAEAEIAEKVGGLLVRSRSTRALLPLLAADDWPAASELEGDTFTLRLPAGALQGAVAAVLPFISTEEAKTHLRGAQLKVSRGRATLAGTNGNRLITLDLDAEVDGAAPDQIVIPATALRLLSAIESECVVTASAFKMRVEAGGATIVSRLMDTLFPDYERVIPSADAPLARVEADDLAAAAGRIAWANREKLAWLGFKFEPGKPALLWAPNTPTPIETELACETFEPIEIGLSAKDIAAIGQVAKGARLTLHAKSNKTPVRVVAEGDERRLVMMPGHMQPYQPNKEMIDG